MLRMRGFLPDSGAVGGGAPTYLTVEGFNGAHLLAAIAAGAVLVIGLAGAGMTAAGLWIGKQADSKIVEAIKSSGVNIASFSAADIAARLSYPPEIAQALVQANDGGSASTLIDHLAAWLRTMQKDQRRPAMEALIELSSSVGASQSKVEIAKAILSIDDTAARSLQDVDVASVLRKLATLAPQDRKTIVAANFPVRPIDHARAQLWATINNQRFPAGDLVAPLADIAVAHPDRLNEIRQYVAAGAPLPSCKPVACQPVACSAVMSGYSCSAGYYLSATPVCAPNPKRSR